MQEPANKKALETGSGILWSEWVKILKPARGLDHKAMAEFSFEMIAKRGKSSSPEWWAQGVAVAYERYIGRRQVGQQSSGKFSVTVSKTVAGDMDEVLALWTASVGAAPVFDTVKSSNVRTSQSDKWRYWRCDLADGSKLSVNIQTKPSDDKSSVAINHDALSTAADVEKWRRFWKGFEV